MVGEFVGEMSMAMWFVALGIAFRRDRRRLLGAAGVVAGIVVAVAGLRNMTGAVAVIAEINNITLPLWLLFLGVVFLREKTRPDLSAPTARR